MKLSKAIAGGLVGAVWLACTSAGAASLVNVKLEDVPAMRIAVDRDSVPRGKVTFRAVNESKDQVHELIVVRVDSPQAALPYDEKKQEVIEKRVRHLGEVADLKPGRSGSLVLDLKPGSYLLICNQPGHYKGGMTTPFTVTK